MLISASLVRERNLEHSSFRYAEFWFVKMNEGINFSKKFLYMLRYNKDNKGQNLEQVLEQLKNAWEIYYLFWNGN